MPEFRFVELDGTAMYVVPYAPDENCFSSPVLDSVRRAIAEQSDQYDATRVFIWVDNKMVVEVSGEALAAMPDLTNQSLMGHLFPRQQETLALGGVYTFGQLLRVHVDDLLVEPFRMPEENIDIVVAMLRGKGLTQVRAWPNDFTMDVRSVGLDLAGGVS